MKLTTDGFNYHMDISLPFIIIKNDGLTNINIKERFKLILINSGKIFVKINSGSFLIKDKSLIILNEYDIASINNLENVDYYVIYFHPAVINARFNFKNIRKSDESFTTTDGLDVYVLIPFIENYNNKFYSLNQLVYKRIENLFMSIDAMLAKQDDKFWPCKSRSFLIELLYVIRSIYENDKNISTGMEGLDDEVGRVVLFLHTNYDKKITLGSLTKSFYTNRTTLSKKFKEKTGLSIMEYLNKLRIDIACQMLRYTNCTIEEISERTGFGDISNFGRTFKKYTALNPTMYKSQFDTMKYI